MQHRQPRPPLMVLGAVLAGLAAMVCVLLIVLPLWPGSETMINDRAVTRAYYVTHALPFVLLATALLLSIVWGVWRERAWVRHVVVAAWVLYVVAAAVVQRAQGGAVGAIVAGLGLTAWSAWYFHVNPRVRRYYAGLPAARPRTGEAASAAPRAR